MPDERQQSEDEQRQAETPEEFDENFDPAEARDAPPEAEEGRSAGRTCKGGPRSGGPGVGLV
ncbi:MAG: hypothetical protein ACYTFQ_32780 [Planctomycetota bacterium]|jgi:hypothetical protein